MFLFPLVYDTSSRETFEKLEEWLNEVEMYSTKKDVIKMLVGNKIDKVNLLRMVVLLLLLVFPYIFRGVDFILETWQELNHCVASSGPSC